MPLDLCDIYGGGCHGCLMARDPYCGWDQGHCVSIFSSQRYVGWDPFSLGEGGHRGGGGENRLQEASVLGTKLWRILGGGRGQGRARCLACLFSLSLPNSRSVLQSINPDEPHKECPNPKPGT